jgi:hypothetical protein
VLKRYHQIAVPTRALAASSQITTFQIRALLSSTVHQTMRLSDAEMRRNPMKLIYPDHRYLPNLTERASRDRSNRLSGESSTFNEAAGWLWKVANLAQYVAPVRAPI